jgi:hypothetical protein
VTVRTQACGFSSVKPNSLCTLYFLWWPLEFDITSLFPLGSFFFLLVIYLKYHIEYRLIRTHFLFYSLFFWK